MAALSEYVSLDKLLELFDLTDSERVTFKDRAYRRELAVSPVSLGKKLIYNKRDIEKALLRGKL